jgi:hypothetical protein
MPSDEERRGHHPVYADEFAKDRSHGYSLGGGRVNRLMSTTFAQGETRQGDYLILGDMTYCRCREQGIQGDLRPHWGPTM